MTGHRDQKDNPDCLVPQEKNLNTVYHHCKEIPSESFVATTKLVLRASCSGRIPALGRQRQVNLL